MYGHIYRMAEAVAEGAQEVEGAEVELHQVPELIPAEVLEKSGAKKAREAFTHIPIAKPADLADADGSRIPSENELAMARFQGRHVATITKKLART